MKPTLSCALASIALAVAPAAAQPDAGAPQAAAPPALGVEIVDPDRALAPDGVRAAIGAELAIRILDTPATSPALGQLAIAVEHGTVHVTYHPPDGTVIERTFALPLAGPDRVQMIAFVATNLVRDQAGEVLGSLPAVPAVVPPPAPPREPPAQVAVTRSPPSTFVPVTLGLVPPLTIDRAIGQRVTVGAGVHFIMGVTDEIRFGSISAAADVVTGTMTGMQVGGAAVATLGDARGLQVAGAAVVARGSIQGAQVAGAASVASRVDGLQISGGASVAGEVNGAQLAGGVNVGGDVRGLQVGVINIARRVRGVQIGVVNVSDDGDDSVPIGIINYSRNGAVAFDGWIDSSRVSAVAFRHGTKHVHNIWSLGWAPDHDNALLGVGLGITVGTASSLTVDIDAMQWLTDLWDAEYGQLDQLRASLTFPLASGVEGFAGIAGNVYVSDVMQDNSADFHPAMARTFAPTTSTTVVIWPSAFVGVRLRVR